MAVLSKARGCGDSRTRGSAYLTTPLSDHGQPVENFLIDPPHPIDPNLGLTPVGVKLVELNGVTHVIDWVGSESYPNVADFVEEVKALGVSRRISRSVDFSRLTAQSRLILVHSRAYIQNWLDYVAAEVDGIDHACPTGRHTKLTDTTAFECCVRHWWRDIEGGLSPHSNPHLMERERLVSRTLPCGWGYIGYHRPPGVTPQYQPAIFASFPIDHIAVINDPDGGSHKLVQERAELALIPVVLENQ